MLDLQTLSELGGPEGAMLNRYIRMIQVQRQDFNGRMLTIRKRRRAGHRLHPRRRRPSARWTGCDQLGLVPGGCCSARPVRRVPPRPVLLDALRLLRVRDLDRPGATSSTATSTGLGREVERAVAAGLPPLTSVFVGGGTPTLVPPDGLVDVLARLPLDAGAEVTVEATRTP